MSLEATSPRSGIDLSYLDPGARPQDDLFGHVNGRWLTDYDIPADRATDGAFRLLADRAEEQVRDLITTASGPVGSDAQRIGDLYASFMDTERVAAVGLAPLLAELALISDAADSAALATVLGALQRTGVGGGAGAYVDTDSKDSTRYLLHFTQSGLGLPDESYYRDPAHAAVLAAYRVAGSLTSLVTTEAASGNEWLPLQKEWRRATALLDDLASGKRQLPLPAIELEDEREDPAVAVVTRPPLYDFRGF